MTRALGSCKYGSECGRVLDCECDCCIVVHECECYDEFDDDCLDGRDDDDGETAGEAGKP